ncbi:MAG: hypothetical protein ABL877_02805 [Thiobacillus sp.]
MKIRDTFTVSVLALSLAFSLSACKKKEETAVLPPPAAAPAPAPLPDLVNVPVSVKQIVLNNKIDEATKQAVPMSAFAPGDTVYAVVQTIGSGKVALKALWTYHRGDKTAQVNETVQEIEAAGPASTAFNVSKPGGWPTGDYQVEVFMNDVSSGVQKFAVK